MEEAWEKRLQSELSRLRHEHEGRSRVERKEAERTRADLQFQITRLQQEIQRLLSTREAEERRRERRARSSCSTRFPLSSASSSASRGSRRARRNCTSLEVSVYKLDYFWAMSVAVVVCDDKFLSNCLAIGP